MPSKVISDQYEAVTSSPPPTAGSSPAGSSTSTATASTINTDMLDPNRMVSVDRDEIEEMKPSPVSMMPEGLLNTLNRDEVLDLIAYLLSRGDRNNGMFK